MMNICGLLNIIKLFCYISCLAIILLDYSPPCSAAVPHFDIERQYAIEMFKERMKASIPAIHSDNDDNNNNNNNNDDDNNAYGREKKNSQNNKGSSSFDKLPSSLRSQVENDIASRNRIQYEEPKIEKELLITAQPEIFEHPIYGSQPGLYFLIPDKVPHNSIIAAVIYFHEFNVNESMKQSNVNHYLLYHPMGEYNKVDAPLILNLDKFTNRGAIISHMNNNNNHHNNKNNVNAAENRSETIMCCDPVDIGQQMEYLLFESENILSRYKLSFFYATGKKDSLGVPRFHITNFNKMPALKLTYIAPRQQVKRDANNLYGDECSSDVVTKCCLVRSTVTLEELGWNSSVSYPTSFEFNWCRGSCSTHWNTENAMIRIRLRANHPEITGVKKMAFTPCCTGIKYAPITLVKNGAHGDVQRETLEKATVLECGCI